MRKWLLFKSHLKYGLKIMLSMCIVLVAALWPAVFMFVFKTLWPLLIYIPYLPVIYAAWETFVEDE